MRYLFQRFIGFEIRPGRLKEKKRLFNFVATGLYANRCFVVIFVLSLINDAFFDFTDKCLETWNELRVCKWNFQIDTGFQIRFLLRGRREPRSTIPSGPSLLFRQEGSRAPPSQVTHVHDIVTGPHGTRPAFIFIKKYYFPKKQTFHGIKNRI